MTDRTLSFTKILDVPRDKVWRCWTEPDLIVQWFTPKPWSTISAKVDVRPGGSSLVVMRSPEGQEFPNPGVYLEVVPQSKLVFTDAYTSAWEPSQKAFMTAVLTFEDAGEGGTKYTACVHHWSEADRLAHEKMGFVDGWGKATVQLVDLAKTLP